MVKVLSRTVVTIVWMSLLALLVAGLMDVRMAWAQQYIWRHWIVSTPPGTYASGVSWSSSGVYVVGYTFGAFAGQTSQGWVDAFVCKYDAYGNLKWTREFGTPLADEALGVAVYGSSVYVVGYTAGAFPGQTNKGSYDAFVRKYDAYGNVKWTLEVGLGGIDVARAVSVSSSAEYFAGDFYSGQIAYVYKCTG